MSVTINNLNITATYSSLSQISLGGAEQISAQSISVISDSFALVGGQVSFGNIFAELPEAPMPRPPAYGVTLAQAAQAFGGFLQSVAPFAGGVGSFGYGAFTQLLAMGQVVDKYLATQALYGQTQVSSLGVYGEATITTPAAMKRVLKDEFAAGNSAGKGKRSNLANSPEVVLALNNILKNHPDNMKIEDLQKKLKQEYGIEAEITKIDGRKALKFKNGDFFVDASGNGMMGNKDYKFAGAVAAIKKKYGLTDQDMKFFQTDEGKKALGAMAKARMQLQMPHTYKVAFGFQTTSVNTSWMGMANGFLDMSVFEPIFAQAYLLAA